MTKRLSKLDREERARPFPVQADEETERGFIPWWLAAQVYEEYSIQFGTKQSLERIADRGGFGRREINKMLRDRARRVIYNATNDTDIGAVVALQLGYSCIAEALRRAPQTWLPGFLITVVEAATKQGVFADGGAAKLAGEAQKRASE